MEMLGPDGAVLRSVDNSSVPEVYGAVNTPSPPLLSGFSNSCECCLWAKERMLTD